MNEQTSNAPAVDGPVQRRVRPSRPKLDRQQRAVLKRMGDARKFPTNTDPCSRHVALMAEGLMRRGEMPIIFEEPQHCGESMAYTVAMLWEARNELAQLKKLARAALPSNWGDDYDTAALAVALGVKA